MKPSEFFVFCPRCGTRQEQLPKKNTFDCDMCGFRYFFNAGSAVAAFLQGNDGRWLFIRRAKEPGKGKLAPPGGFVDIGETAESAVTREVLEELGIEILDLRFIRSEPNTYYYREVTYPVLDLFFVARVAAGAKPRALDDVSEFGWFKAPEIAVNDLAFPSMQAAWCQLLCPGPK